MTVIVTELGFNYSETQTILVSKTEEATYNKRKNKLTLKMCWFYFVIKAKLKTKSEICETEKIYRNSRCLPIIA